MIRLEERVTLEAGLASLRTYDADPERVERIRARCTTAFADQRLREASGRACFTGWRSWLGPAVAFGLSALYLAAAFGSSLALMGARLGR